MTAEVPEHLENTIRNLERYSRMVAVPKELSGREEAQLLADAIRKNGKIKHFTMEWSDRGADECEPLFEALAEIKTLHNLRLSGNWLRDRQAGNIAAIIDNNPSLEFLAVADTGLTSEGVGTIASSLKGHSNILSANFTNNSIGNQGAKHLAELITHCPELYEIMATDCEIGDEGIAAITEAMTGNTTLCALNLSNNPCSREANEELAQTILATESPNFNTTGMPHAHPEVNELCKRNRLHIQKAAETLENAHPGPYEDDNGRIYERESELDGLCAAEIMAVHRCLPAIYHNGAVDDAADAFRDMLESMPEPAKGAELTPESLTKRNYRGHCALDHPETWQNFDKIAAQLAENNTPLTREFLDQSNHNGEKLLTIGLTFAPESTIETLNAQGIRIGHADLISADPQKPTPIYKALANHGALNAAFSPNNWKGASADELRATYQALPEDAREQVFGYHILTASLRLANRSTEQGR